MPTCLPKSLSSWMIGMTVWTSSSPLTRLAIRTSMSGGMSLRVLNSTAILPTSTAPASSKVANRLRRPSSAPSANSVMPSPASRSASLIFPPWSARPVMESMTLDTASAKIQAAPAMTARPAPITARDRPKAIRPGAIAVPVRAIRPITRARPAMAVAALYIESQLTVSNDLIAAANTMRAPARTIIPSAMEVTLSIAPAGMKFMATAKPARATPRTRMP